MSSPNQPSQGIVFEVAVDASDLIENDPDVLRAVDDLLSTPISENFREDALDAVADVQLSCEADFQRYCVSSSTPTVSSVNIDDFLLSFGSFGPVEMEWARRRLKKASKSQSQLKTSSSFLNEIKRRILQAPLDLPAPHSGAHVGISPSSTSSTPLKLTKEQRKELTNKLNKLHKTGKTDKNKSMKLASKERQRRLQFKHESYHFSGGPSKNPATSLFDLFFGSPIDSVSGSNIDGDDEYGVIDGVDENDDDVPIPLQGFFFGPPISDSDGDDGDDDDDDGDDDVPTLQGPHSHLANPLLRTAHHDHDHHDHNHLSGPGPGPNSLDFPEDEDTYQYQLGYGSLGDICMLQNVRANKASQRCITAVGGLGDLRLDYTDEVQADSIEYQYGPGPNGNHHNHPFFLFLILFTIGIVYYRRHQKMRKIRNILNVIEASPVLKAQVEEAAGVSIPPHHESCKDCSTCVKTFFKVIFRAFLYTIAFFFILVTSIVLAQNLLGLKEDENGETEDGGFPALLLFLIIAALETVLLNKLVTKLCKGKRCGTCTGDGDRDGDGVGSNVPVSEISSPITAQHSAYTQLASDSSHGTSGGGYPGNAGAQHTQAQAQHERNTELATFSFSSHSHSLVNPKTGQVAQAVVPHSTVTML